MSLSRRQAIVRQEPAYLLPSEGWLVAQTVALVMFVSWSLGGMAASTQDWSLALALGALLLLGQRWRETREIAVRPLVPLLLWGAFAAIAVLNPSHVPLPGGGWGLRADWTHWLPTTVDVAHTLADARVWLAALAQGAAFRALLRSTTAARLIWGALGLNGFALAAAGAFFHFAGSERLLGFIDSPGPAYFFASFIYKNHWAAFGCLASVAALALALRNWPAASRRDPQARGRAFCFGAIGVLTAVTLPLPGSRTGVVMAALIVTGFFVMLLWPRRENARVRRPAFGGMAAGLATISAGILLFGAIAYAPRATLDLVRSRQQIDQLAAGAPLDIRLLLSRDTWRMAVARPWFGWGPGCFEIVFPAYHGSDYLRQPDGRPSGRPEFAHNDWLQLPAETGVAGTALLLIPVAIVATRSWRRAGRAGRFGLAGCALVAAQGWVDFPFHNPAVLLLWTTLLTTAHRFDPAEDSGDRPAG